MKKKVYLTNIKWKPIYEDKGGVTASLVFSDLITLEEYNRLLNFTHFLLEILGGKDEE